MDKLSSKRWCQPARVSCHRRLNVCAPPHTNVCPTDILGQTTTSTRAYAGHKQPGLHGSKSFGVLWGDTAGGPCRQKERMAIVRSAPGDENNHTLHGGDGRKLHRRLRGRHSSCGGLRKVVAEVGGRGGNVGVGLESVGDRRGSGRRWGQGGADLVPVRGISRVSPLAT